ncbi:MAG: PaaI family thioesterase [Burkholderiales bacterium]|nr:PaaI family thioesterase [Burkholderiales bacterium]
MPFHIRIPFVEALGFELHRFGAGEAEIRVDVQESHTNSWQVAHGGVVMTLLDVAMAHAAKSGGHADGAGVATIEMKTSFMRPAEGRLRAVGKLLHRTATMAFCEATVHDESDQLCAQATGTFKLLRGGLPAEGRVAKQIHNTKPEAT